MKVPSNFVGTSNFLIAALRQIGIEQQETPINRLRQQLSRKGFRCIRLLPETWAKVAPETKHEIKVTD